MEYKIENINFSGPLDLLLDLIKKNKCEIKDILIVNIINQYLDVIESMSKSKLEISSEFIVMAASLMEIKSKYFIFLNDELGETDPSKDLIQMLEIYSYFKSMAEELKKSYDNTEVIYMNKPFEVLTQDILDFSKYNAEDLLKSYMGTMRFVQKPKSQIISFKKISIDDKIRDIEELLQKNSNIYFTNILNTTDKDEVVASLLGVLELTKEQRVEIYQKQVFKDILIERLY